MLDNILNLNIDDFFSVIQTIKIGYKDNYDMLHYDSDDDFYEYDYLVSSHQEVIDNNCGWCFDITNLIQLYCEYHNYEHTTLFVEYEDQSNYVSQIQVFLKYQNRWYFAQDNSIKETFGSFSFTTKEDCIKSFMADFKSYLQYSLKENYLEDCLFIKEFNYTFESGSTFETCLSLIHKKFN